MILNCDTTDCRECDFHNCGIKVATVVDETADMGMRTEITCKADRQTGRWKRISPAKIYECSVCGGCVMTDDIVAYEYCHHCGAKMEG